MARVARGVNCWWACVYALAGWTLPPTLRRQALLIGEGFCHRVLPRENLTEVSAQNVGKRVFLCIHDCRDYATARHYRISP
jgi:hypothetical protein